MNLIAENKVFGGRQLRYQHSSSSLGCEMMFSIYLPPLAATEAVPVLYWLSGLTCSDENFVQKAGAQRYAAEQGVAIVATDTSPRGADIAGYEASEWDFGQGAGFYVDATSQPWDKNYQMYRYISEEIPQLIQKQFNVLADKQSIFGHSMGGHGALTIALKNPNNYCSVSAFAPICSPMNCDWGKKALMGYLGDNQSLWQSYDTCALIKNFQQQHGRAIPFQLLIEQGNRDEFLTSQLRLDLLQLACEQSETELLLNRVDGYDHSYFFIASFIEKHIKFHADQLRKF